MNAWPSNAASSPTLCRVTTLVAAVVLVLGSAIAGWSQSSTTSLRGTVTDSQAAVIAGAEVVLADAATGFSRTQKTDAHGVYQLLQVPPGTYTVSVSAARFTTSRRENVVLQVNTPATLNFVLRVGATTTTVDVQGEAPPVNTVDASLGNPFAAKQILELPSEGRNAVELLSLQAGVAYVGNQVDTAADSRGGAVNGARSDQTNVTVDGLDNNDQLLGDAFTGVLRIPMDSLEEFRVVTTNSNADSGRSSGAQVSLVTKSGSNQFHGTAYEYNRSSLGTANDWFNEHEEVQNGLPNKPGELIRNTFGGAVGGPILKNRFFFFSNYEGQRSREAVQVAQPVPSANLRQGIVGYACTPGYDANLTSGDAACAIGTPGVTTSSLVPNGDLLMTMTPADIQSIDQGCLASGTCPNGNGPSQAVLTQWNGGATLPDGTAIPAFPMPNTDASSSADGINILGYTFAAPQPTNENTYLLKLDYKLTQNGNHSLFVRGNLQNDRQLVAAEFPGQPPSQILRTNNKGVAVGYTAVLSNTLINDFRYALIREGVGTQGDNPYSNVSFQDLADQVSFLRTVNVNVPVNQFVDDITWTHGKHTFQFGGNWRIVENNRFSNEQNFLNGATHPDWLADGEIAGSLGDLDPSESSLFPSVDPLFGFSYDAAISDVTGILGSISAWYNQSKSGQFVPTGNLVPRHFRANEAEFYAQDAWHATPHLQLTFGLRYTLLQPPYETQGNQVAPTPSLNSFYEKRAAAMLQGETYAPVISFALSGQANGKQPYWNWDYNDVAPRFAFAYSPKFDSGLFHKLFGDHDKSSIRGGYGIYYDHFGQGVVNSFDREGSLGLTTYLVNPSGLSTVSCVSRFVSLTVLPTGDACPATPGGVPVPELPSPPPGGFPLVPPTSGNGSFAIGWGIDSGMRTPYSHVVDFSITRELPNHFVFELAYVGRFGRHLLQEVDLAQPLDLVDPKSKTDYYQAATALVKLANAGTPESSVPNIPYWQNLFPSAAGAALETMAAPGIPANPTATQNVYDLYYANGNNATYALQSLDAYCFPACSTLRPFAYWDDQFSSMFSWRTTGTSSYNGMQATLRRHVGGLEFDFNYTYSKSQDENSNAERVNEYENGSGVAVAYSGQVVNAWAPKQLYSVSDFDTTHQINANWMYELPFGRGKRWAGGSSGLGNGVVGGWQVSGLTRWSSGYPFSISTYAFPTNYEQDSRAVLLGAAPRTGAFIASSGDPNVFQAGPNAASAFRFAYPGESGERNNLRGPGYFGVDMSLAKLWKIAESQSLRFSWDVFNVTNAVRFDVGSLSQYLLYQPSLGDFTQTLTHPRVMQFGLRYSF